MGWERHLLIGCADRTEQEKAWAEIKHLRSIVDTLPQCYRLVDGKPVQDCPMTPGMEVWVPGTGMWDDKIWKIKVTSIDSKGFVCTNIGGRPQWWHSRACANSRECAEVLAATRKETK